MSNLQRKSLAQEVAETILQDIQNGRYAINEKLPTEPDFMKTFGVGRSTVREAIRYLAQSGYVNPLQGIGTFVISNAGNESLDNTVQRADFAELVEVRQLLEIKIAEKAALNRNDDHLQRLKAELEKRRHYALEDKLEECLQADIQFHILLAESCGNQLLYKLYKTVSVQLTEFFSRAYTNTDVFLKSQKLHEELYECIRVQNPVKTLRIVNKIISTL
ncbi:GntR family transcriptional regulator [Larkinella harenae]